MSQTQFYTFSNSYLRFSVESNCISRMIDLTYGFLPVSFFVDRFNDEPVANDEVPRPFGGLEMNE